MAGQRLMSGCLFVEVALDGLLTGAMSYGFDNDLGKRWLTLLINFWATLKFTRYLTFKKL
jgi:hypothetical protein